MSLLARRATCVVFLGALMLTACGSSGSSKAVKASGASTVLPADGTSGADPAAPLVDPCSLLTDEEITSTFSAVDTQYAAHKFHNTHEAQPVSATTVSCEFLWNVLDTDGGPLAGGTFLVEVGPLSKFDQLLAGQTTTPIPAIPGAKRLSGVAYAKVGQYTVDISNINTDAIADRLLLHVLAKLR